MASSVPVGGLPGPEAVGAVASGVAVVVVGFGSVILGLESNSSMTSSGIVSMS